MKVINASIEDTKFTMKELLALDNNALIDAIINKYEPDDIDPYEYPFDMWFNRYGKNEFTYTEKFLAKCIDLYKKHHTKAIKCKLCKVLNNSVNINTLFPSIENPKINIIEERVEMNDGKIEGYFNMPLNLYEEASEGDLPIIVFDGNFPKIDILNATESTDEQPEQVEQDGNLNAHNIENNNFIEEMKSYEMRFGSMNYEQFLELYNSIAEKGIIGEVGFNMFYDGAIECEEGCMIKAVAELLRLPTIPVHITFVEEIVDFYRSNEMIEWLNEKFKGYIKFHPSKHLDHLMMANGPLITQKDIVDNYPEKIVGEF